jgi:hypothetical protein
MKFIPNRRYWSDDKYEIYVCNRFDKTGLLRAEVGFGLPANYKIRKDALGCEWIKAKGRVYRAFP